MKRTHHLTYTAILVAINVLFSQFFYIMIGPVKALPMQHLVNVLTAVIAGPWFAVAGALISSLIRIMTHAGTIFAFPGSMIGALCAGLLYKRFKKVRYAVIGEAVGTGVIGSLCCIPLIWVMNLDTAALKIIVPAFLLSSLLGSVIAGVIIQLLMKRNIIKG